MTSVNHNVQTAADSPAALELRTRVLRHKPFLHNLYCEWYGHIAAALPPGPGAVVELGAGGSFLREFVPGLVTSDILPHGVVQVALDGCRLPFRSGSLRGLVMTNVFHHFPDARAFLAEANRCLRPNGVVSAIEPWVTPWSRLVYSHLHHEPFAPDAPAWEQPAGHPLSGGNNALAWIVFARDRARFEATFPQLRVHAVTLLAPLRYALAGGVSRPALTPGWSFGVWRGAESLLKFAFPCLAMFAHVVLVRRDRGAA
jgi:SAM-dependent methyltransferase